MIRWAIEWIWALYAYICGRVFRWGKYRILRERCDDYIVLVRFSFPITPSCLKKLMRLWRCREVIGEELETLLGNVNHSTAPFLGYDSVDSHTSKRIVESYDLRIVLWMGLLMISPLIVLLVEYLIDLTKK